MDWPINTAPGRADRRTRGPGVEEVGLTHRSGEGASQKTGPENIRCPEGYGPWPQGTTPWLKVVDTHPSHTLPGDPSRAPHLFPSLVRRLLGGYAQSRSFLHSLHLSRRLGAQWSTTRPGAELGDSKWPWVAPRCCRGHGAGGRPGRCGGRRGHTPFSCTCDAGTVSRHAAGPFRPRGQDPHATEVEQNDEGTRVLGDTGAAAPALSC